MNLADLPRPPTVQLVGAGPGSPDLLTLRAVRAIAQAQLILCDDLVDPEVLAHKAPGCRVLMVGKRGGCPSADQRFIHGVMVREALQGTRVVRLKGGDPFVFGRGGEECDALREAGIHVEVVPGLTAGIAGPAAIGIPVTDRRHAPGVALVTGHAQDGGRGPDWAALARSGLTLVIYMGVSRLGATVQALRDGGLAADTPAAMVCAAHTPRQRQVVATLGTLDDEVARHGLASPAVVVIGSVVRQAAALQEAVTLAGSGPDRRASGLPSATEPPCHASTTTTPCPSAARRSFA
jgi:uroporphyrin-III C-methyltransferase